ncbi:hypothetical protein [Methylobacter sp.]|uniref:hypothetical protein n=1 Tax=Methylobacter sp. TaxID=2051955 RepID=UPI003DA59F07
MRIRIQPHVKIDGIGLFSAGTGFGYRLIRQGPVRAQYRQSPLNLVVAFVDAGLINIIQDQRLLIVDHGAADNLCAGFAAAIAKLSQSVRISFATGDLK